MHGPDWVLGLLIGMMVAAIAAGLAGLLVLAWFAWQQRAAWWRWPVLAGIGWLLLGTGISLGVLLAEWVGIETGGAADYAFVLSLALVGTVGLPLLMWRIWRRQGEWWRWPALAATAWLLLSTLALLQQIVANLG